MAVTVAVSFTPQVIASLGRVRDARRLRGRPCGRGRHPRAWRCPCSRAPWSARWPWPPPWTAGASAAGRSRPRATRGLRGHAGRAARARRRRLRRARFGRARRCSGCRWWRSAPSSSWPAWPRLAAAAARYRPDRWAGREWLTVRGRDRRPWPPWWRSGRQHPAALTMPVYPLALPGGAATGRGRAARRRAPVGGRPAPVARPTAPGPDDLLRGRVGDLSRRRSGRRSRDVDLEIGEGELALVIGPTGAGKSTLLRSVNGLVPHFSGGRLHGPGRWSPGAARPTTGRATWPTWSGSSARIPTPPSWPTSSRTSWPTAWRTSGLDRPRPCVDGWRTSSTS